MNRFAVFSTGLSMGIAIAAFGAQLNQPAEAALAPAPQCLAVVNTEPSSPDIRELVKLMPAYVRNPVKSPTLPKPKPDEIANLIGDMK